MNKANVALRGFPFPAHCAVAISSDIDNASSVDSFKEIMNYFNTSSNTIFGNGLGLEVGNSFWFYTNSNKPQLSYFEGITTTKSKFAPIIRELWKSGHIDTMHSWGNFDLGGFDRSLADAGLNELKKCSTKIPVWVNHGVGLNLQKLGNYPNMKGDDPSHDAYHLDLSVEAGCEYFWIGKTTHIIGQNSQPSITNKLKLGLQWLIKRTKYYGTKDPIYDDGNELLFPIEFRDGRKMWEFIRFINAWGQEHILDIHELTKQLHPSIIKRLIKNQGYMILYTHFNEHVDLGGLPQPLVKNLFYLQKHVVNGNILMGTTSRILKYKEIRDYLSYKIVETDNEVKIKVQDFIETPIGVKKIQENQLMGVTFYCDTPEKTTILLGKTKLDFKINPKDETGRQSISIPWQNLVYPS